MWLLLGSLSTGMAYADLSKNESEIDIVQQSGICQGIVKDATGESVIGHWSFCNSKRNYKWNNYRH